MTDFLERQTTAFFNLRFKMKNVLKRKGDPCNDRLPAWVVEPFLEVAAGPAVGLVVLTLQGEQLLQAARCVCVWEG